jgi:F-type H+-transporting ATPase subunit gamma
MAKTREIKKRIKAVGNIRRITKTMQMIATSKFARAQQAAVAGKPYTETVFELVADLTKRLEGVSHPLLGSSSPKAAASGKDLTLVITSDRGLAGPYNGSVLRQAMQLFRSTPSARVGEIEVVGKKGLGFMKFQKVDVSKSHQFGDKITYEMVRTLAEDLIRRFSAGELATVRVVYMKYISAGKQAPTVLQLLPFDASAAAAGKGASSEKAGPASIYEFSPDAAALLGDILPAAVKAVLFQCFNDAVVSEHVARMVAMKSATDAAGKMGKIYTRKYNRARQAQITTELTEIISGAAALG